MEQSRTSVLRHPRRYMLSRSVRFRTVYVIVVVTLTVLGMIFVPRAIADAAPVQHHATTPAENAPPPDTGGKFIIDFNNGLFGKNTATTPFSTAFMNKVYKAYDAMWPSFGKTHPNQTEMSKNQLQGYLALRKHTNCAVNKNNVNNCMPISGSGITKAEAGEAARVAICAGGVALTFLAAPASGGTSLIVGGGAMLCLASLAVDLWNP